jgi:hypothetical protein
MLRKFGIIRTGRRSCCTLLRGTMDIQFSPTFWARPWPQKRMPIAKGKANSSKQKTCRLRWQI